MDRRSAAMVEEFIMRGVSAEEVAAFAAKTGFTAARSFGYSVDPGGGYVACAGYEDWAICHGGERLMRRVDGETINPWLLHLPVEGGYGVWALNPAEKPSRRLMPRLTPCGCVLVIGALALMAAAAMIFWSGHRVGLWSSL